MFGASSSTAQGVQTGGVGQPEVEQDAVDLAGQREHGLGQVARPQQVDAGAGVQQQLADEERVALVVLDEQHPHGKWSEPARSQVTGQLARGQRNPDGQPVTRGSLGEQAVREGLPRRLVGAPTSNHTTLPWCRRRRVRGRRPTGAPAGRAAAAPDRSPTRCANRCTRGGSGDESRTSTRASSPRVEDGEQDVAAGVQDRVGHDLGDQQDDGVDVALPLDAELLAGEPASHGTLSVVGGSRSSVIGHRVAHPTTV